MDHDDLDFDPKKNTDRGRKNNPTSADYAAEQCPNPECKVTKKAFFADYEKTWIAAGWKKEALKPCTSWGHHVRRARTGIKCEPNTMGRVPAPVPAAKPAAKPAPVPAPAPVQPAAVNAASFFEQAKVYLTKFDGEVKGAQQRLTKRKADIAQLDQEIEEMQKKRKTLSEDVAQFEAKIKRAHNSIESVSSGLFNLASIASEDPAAEPEPVG